MSLKQNNLLLPFHNQPTNHFPKGERTVVVVQRITRELTRQAAHNDRVVVGRRHECDLLWAFLRTVLRAAVQWTHKFPELCYTWTEVWFHEMLLLRGHIPPAIVTAIWNWSSCRLLIKSRAAHSVARRDTINCRLVKGLLAIQHFREAAAVRVNRKRKTRPASPFDLFTSPQSFTSSSFSFAAGPLLSPEHVSHSRRQFHFRSDAHQITTIQFSCHSNAAAGAAAAHHWPLNCNKTHCCPAR